MPRLKWFISLVVLLGSFAALPAYAETKIKPDPAGDARASIDITRAKYTHADRHVKVLARIPALRRTGEAALSISRFEIFEAGYVVLLEKRPGQPAEVGLYYFNHVNLEPRECDDVSGRWGRSSIRLSVARRCLDGHATPRVFAQFGLSQGERVDFAPAAPRLARD